MNDRVPHDPWSQTVKDRWFFGALAASTISVAYLFSAFATALLFAAVVVVVTWPIYERMLARMRGRSALAAILTTLMLAVVVFAPVSFVVYLFVQQAVSIAQMGIDWVKSGKIQDQVDWILALPESEAVPQAIRDFIPKDLDIAEAVAGPLQEAALGLLDGARTFVPGLLSGTVNAGVNGLIFVFAVITLYMEGPRVLGVLKNLSPIDDSYEEKLFDVFREFSNNMVMGALATAVGQGVVAGIGYAIAGVDRVIFFALLTTVFSLVPVIGAALVYLPLTVLTFATQGPLWGAFLLAWSLIVVSSVDNFVRPMFMRGKTNIHPLLIFLAVFGGMGWMGLPGALVGPVLVAFFLALYTIYVHDYLKRAPELTAPVTPSVDDRVPGTPATGGPETTQPPAAASGPGAPEPR